MLHNKICTFFILFLSLSACSLAVAGTQGVDTSQMHSLISNNTQNKDFMILDVSPSAAYNSSHLEGATSFPADSPDFEENIKKLDRNKTYLVYCHKMKWTPNAIKFMEENGFKNLFASVEGKEGWMKFGNVVVSTYLSSVDTKQMQKLISENKSNENFVIVDVSPSQSYAKARLAGALSIPANDPNFEINIKKLDNKKTYLIYCYGGRWTPQAIPFMKQNGFNNVIASTEGLSGWIQAGYKVSSDNME